MIYKERIESLKKSILADNNYGYKEEAFEMIESCVGSFSEYVKAVVLSESALHLSRPRFGNAEFLEYTSELDKRRTIAHDNALASISMINRLASKFGLQPVFPDAENMDRATVADKYIMLVVAEYFSQRSR